MKLFKIFIGPSLVLIWLIANTIYVVKKLRKTIKDENKDTEIVVKCEKCETEHSTNINELLSTNMSKKIYTTTSINIGFFGLSTPNYKYYAKKVHCPICNKKTWSEVKNYNDLSLKNTKLSIPIILKYFASLIIGGEIIFFIVDIFI